jgi:MraZ protein
LTLPPELRDEFASGVVITRGFQDYLHLIPKAVWDQLMEPELTGGILDERIADLNVQFRAGKTVSEIDRKQGRIMVEQHLLDYANIEREVMLIRVGPYFRLVRKE